MGQYPSELRARWTLSLYRLCTGSGGNPTFYDELVEGAACVHESCVLLTAEIGDDAEVSLATVTIPDRLQGSSVVGTPSTFFDK
jgi:hypothetical protein